MIGKSSVGMKRGERLGGDAVVDHLEDIC
jgi:hypothetical protein